MVFRFGIICRFWKPRGGVVLCVVVGGGNFRGWLTFQPPFVKLLSLPVSFSAQNRCSGCRNTRRSCAGEINNTRRSCAEYFSRAEVAREKKTLSKYAQKLRGRGHFFFFLSKYAQKLRGRGHYFRTHVCICCVFCVSFFAWYFVSVSRNGAVEVNDGWLNFERTSFV